MLNKNDFVLDRIDEDNGYEDYWYRVKNESADMLTDKYMEMCMVGVTDVVYSKTEDLVGVRRQFPFNFDVVISTDDELNSLLKEICIS